MLCKQHIRLLDTTVGAFLGPSFGSMATKYLKRLSEEGTDREWYRGAWYAARTTSNTS